jgi:ATP-dependent DNA helicase RecQ
VVIAELVEQGFLIKESVDKKQVYRKTGQEGKPDLGNYEAQRQVKLRELHTMIRYASMDSGCRMSLLRKSLGDEGAAPCGRCDLCSPIEKPVVKEKHTIDAWLAEKPVTIPASRMFGLEEGVSLLDSKLRAPVFVRFMQGRQEGADLDPELLELLQKHLKKEGIRAVVPLPSITWKGREATAKAVADWLGVPLHLDLLSWKTAPVERQGALMNNDQRKANVQATMETAEAVPEGPLLLLDDYIGSGSTLREAARALRESGGRKIKLIPFTIASVKWRLGKTGFI